MRPRPRIGRPRRLRYLLIVLGALGAVLAPAAPASAHSVLLHTDPGTGAIVQDAPGQVTLTFNEPVQLVASAISVIAPDGKRISGTPQRTGDGSVVRIPLRAPLPKGTFLVTYRVISADSHPVAGGFSFSLGAPSKSAPMSTGGAGAAETPVVAAAMPVVRFLGFAGLILLVGPALVLLSLWPTRLSRRGPARLVRLGLLLVGVATLAEFYLQMPYSTGSGLLDVSYHDVVEAMNSRFGWAHLLRLVLLVAAIPLLVILTSEKRNRLSTGERVVLGLMAVVGIGTWGYGGHPSTSPVPLVTVLADLVHLAAMSVWLGGLVMLIGFLVRQARPTELRALLPVWSRWATGAVVLLAAAGVGQACLQLGSPAALVSTTYGQLIIAKVVAFAVIMAFAAYSRATVRRFALAGTSSASARPDPAAEPARPAGGAADRDASDYADDVWDEVYGAAVPARERAAALADPVAGRHATTERVPESPQDRETRRDRESRLAWEARRSPNWQRESVLEGPQPPQHRDTAPTAGTLRRHDRERGRNWGRDLPADRPGTGLPAAGGRPAGAADAAADSGAEGVGRGFPGAGAARPGRSGAGGAGASGPGSGSRPGGAGGPGGGGAGPVVGSVDDPGGARQEPDGAGALRRGLRRLCLVEVAIAVAVLGISAVLVQTTPARSAASVASQHQDMPYSATLNSSLFSLQVQVDPAATGNNTLHAIAYHPSDGRPVRVLEWHATASLPGGGIGPVDIPLKPITDNHAIADVALPKAGKWRFAFTIRVSAIDEDTVTTTVTVR